jgi:GntR family transcriptional repressor for pyruvate dehydrogenase complex
MRESISSDHQTDALSNQVLRAVATFSTNTRPLLEITPVACQSSAHRVTSSLVCWSDKSMSYQPLERRKVYEQIAEQLLGQIGTRRLKPGDSLPPERELTESFGVGRSSIREALRMLESQGVITSVSGGAFVVSDPAMPLNSSLRLVFSLDERAGLDDLFELRRILECEAAALAAERRSEAHLADMDAAVAEMAASLGDARAEERFINADLRFHLAVAEATANRLVLHSMQAVRDLVRRALLTIVLIPGSPESAVIEHSAIRAAIASGDSGNAREEMRAHLARVRSDVAKGAFNG